MTKKTWPTITDRNVAQPSRVKISNAPEAGPDVFDIKAVPGTTKAEGTFLNKTLFDSMHSYIDQNDVPLVITGGTGAAYTATVPQWLGLERSEWVGRTLAVRFHADSTSYAPTLNVNNLGARPVALTGALSTLSAGPLPTQSFIKKASVSLLYFDAQNTSSWIILSSSGIAHGAEHAINPWSLSKGGTGAGDAANAAKNLHVCSLGFGFTSMPSNADLNTFTATGNFCCSTDAIAKTIKNTPFGSAGSYAFNLTVEASLRSQPMYEYARQIFQEHRNHSEAYSAAPIYERVRVIGGKPTEWGPWHLMAGHIVDNTNSGLTLSVDGKLGLSVPVTVAHGGTGATKKGDVANNLGLLSLTAPVTSIPAKTDLNTMKTPGNYGVQASSVAATILNTPYGKGAVSTVLAFNLTVEHAAKSNTTDPNNYIRQRFREYTGKSTAAVLSVVFERYFLNDTGAKKSEWSPWKAVSAYKIGDSLNLSTDGTLDVKGPIPVAKGGTGGISKAQASNNLSFESMNTGFIDMKTGYDLDHYTVIGNYGCSSTAIAQTILNTPYSKTKSAKASAFNLTVRSSLRASVTTEYIIQKYQEYREEPVDSSVLPGVIFERAKQPGKPFGPWKVVAGYRMGSGLSLTDEGVLSATGGGGGGGYTLPPATKATLGGVKIGSNITVTSDGTISATAAYKLPPATKTSLGGVKAGNNLSVTADGTLTAQCPWRVGDILWSTQGNNPELTWIGTKWERIGNEEFPDGARYDPYLQPTMSDHSLGAKIGSLFHTHYIPFGWDRNAWYIVTDANGDPGFGSSVAVTAPPDIVCKNGSWAMNETDRSRILGTSETENMPPTLLVACWKRTA